MGHEQVIEKHTHTHTAKDKYHQNYRRASMQYTKRSIKTVFYKGKEKKEEDFK